MLFLGDGDPLIRVFGAGNTRLSRKNEQSFVVKISSVGNRRRRLEELRFKVGAGRIKGRPFKGRVEEIGVFFGGDFGHGSKRMAVIIVKMEEKRGGGKRIGGGK